MAPSGRVAAGIGIATAAGRRRVTPSPSGQLRYFLTFEYRERVGQGSFNRVTLEVDQLEWMRFHSGGEVCVIPRMEGMSLRNCS